METIIEATAKALEDEPNPEDVVIEVKCGFETLAVTRKAKNSMSSALDAMSNQPTLFFRCEFAVTAVTDILGVDMMQYSCPQTDDDIQSFDWESVVVGRRDTYPIGIQPTELEFEKVRSVHRLVKDEKDKQARAMGQPKSSVQSYITYKQRWKQWRDICAVYKHMNPAMALNTLHDLLKVQLKMCNSMHLLEEVMHEDMKKFIAKQRRETKKIQDQIMLEQKLASLREEEKAAKAKAKEAAATQLKIVQEQDALKDQVFEGSRSAAGKARKAAIQAKRNEEAEALKALQKAQALALAKREEKAQLKRKKKQQTVVIPILVQKKKLKRNDITRLDDKIVPSKKVELDGPAWAPPTRDRTEKQIVYIAPGDSWLKESKNKINLLFALERLLKAQNLTEQPLTFSILMEFIGVEEMTFNGRIFLYYVALTLHQKR